MNAAKRMYFLQSEYSYNLVHYKLSDKYSIPSRFSSKNMPKIVLSLKNMIHFFAFIDQKSSRI